MPRKRLALRSVPPPQRSPLQRSPPQRSPPPRNVALRPGTPRNKNRVKLRSTPPPTKPTKLIVKKHKFADLSDVLITRVLDICNAKDILRGRPLYTIREAFSLALTCSRYFSLFRNRLQVVDALYPASKGYPSPIVPHYLSPTQMTWIARLAQGRLRAMRLPDYVKGTIDVLVGVEYCCHYIQEIGFTDRGAVFPNLATSLFTACKMLTKVEIRAPQKSTLQGMWQSNCEFTEIVLLDVSPDCLNAVCALVETKGKTLKLLQVAFDICPRYEEEHGIREEDERSYTKVQAFGDYITEHALVELPQLDVLDISSSPYYVVAHDPWDVLDDEERPAVALLRSLKSEFGRLRSGRKRREAGRKARKIGVLRVRCANLELANDMVVNHVPLNQARTVEVVFPGGSLLFDSDDEKRPTVTSVQLGMHLRHGKDCITKESRSISTIDLGNEHFMEMYYHDEVGTRASVAKIVLQECGNINTVRGVFSLRKDASLIKMAYIYITKVMKFAMLTTTLELSYEIVMYGHAINEDFREMISCWKKVRIVRLMNPANYGFGILPLTEGDCLAFMAGLQWFLELLKEFCPAVQAVFLEDLKVAHVWKNAPGTRNCIMWAIHAVDTFENASVVDCGTLKATLKSWLIDCK